MARLVQFKRGTTDQNEIYNGLVGELTVDTEKQTLVLHDGNGGFSPMATEDNVQVIENKTLSLADNSFPGIDGDGLEIVSNVLNLDDTVVRTTGAQNIDDSKTFTSGININNSSGILTDQSDFSIVDNNATNVSLGLSAIDVSIGSGTGNTTINHDLVVSGDFTVSGTFITTEEETVIVEDKNIILGQISSPTDATADGGGIILKGTTDKTFLWRTTGDHWESSEDINLVEFKSYKIDGSDVLSATSLGSTIVNSSLESLGTVTSGTWEADLISTEYGGTGQSTYVNGELLIGNSTGNTLSKSTLDAGTGISVTNNPGAITLTNTDRGSSQFIFKNIIDSENVAQIVASQNNDSIKLVSAGSAFINFDSENYIITIGAEGEEYTAGDGLNLSSSNEFSLDDTTVRTSGNQVINDTKTFNATISGNIDGNAVTASRLDPGAFINGVFFDGSENINLPSATLDNDLIAGDGISSSGPYNGSVERTFINSDKGSTQSIFKEIQNSSGTTQFSASNNSDVIQFGASGDLAIEFDSTNNRITYSLNVPEGSVYTAGDGLELTGDEFSVDDTVVRTSGDQTIGGIKTIVEPLELSSQANDLTQAVRADRAITTGDGLTGGGTFDSDIDLSVDSSVIRDTGNQSIAGTKTFVNTIVATSASPGILLNEIGSTSATFDLLSEDVTTINLGGAATEINIGASSGQTNFAHDVNIDAGSSYKIDDTSVFSIDTLGSTIINSSLESVGTISNGTWQAGTILEAYGGTGESSYTDGQLLIGNSDTNGLSKSTLIGGTNISITNGNGSVQIDGPFYTAGNGIERDGLEFSVTAGNGLVQTSTGLELDTGSLVTIGDDQTITGTKTFSTPVILSSQASSTNHAVRASRNINTGNGLTGGGDLTGDLNLSISSSVVQENTSPELSSLGVGISAPTSTGDIRASGSITAYAVSDERLKENVVELNRSLDSIEQIRGVSFDWTEEEIARQGGEDDYFVRKQSVGVIAQEVEKILPEAVATRPDGYKAVRYELLVPLLIQGMKEQQEQIKMLEEKVETLWQHR